MPFISKAQELRKLNVGLHSRMCALVQKAEEEKRALTTEENQEWDRMDKEYETRSEEIAKHEKLEQREDELGTLDPRRAGREKSSNPGQQSPERNEAEARGKALRAFLSKPPSTWDQETRALVEQSQREAPEDARSMGHCFVLTGPRKLNRNYSKKRLDELREELRFLGIDTAGKGQETIPQEFMAELDTAMLSFSGILQTARVITTSTGAAMPWPKVNDTAQIGELLAEDTDAAEADPAFTGVTFDAFVYSSKAARIANTLLQDSAFNLPSLIAEMLGIRLGRILNQHGTTGTGTAQPRGVVTAVLAETTPVAAAGTTAIVYEDLVNLEHSVDPAYRTRAVWMMHDSIVKHIKKLKDADGRPLWSSGLSVREPETILGYRWFINQDMDADPPAVGEESILFGDFSKYIIRRVINPVLVRLDELYALKFQTGFVMFDRWDSDLVDAGTGPIKVLQH